MRIGILTLPLNTNYGGILQAYALRTVLERMGHEVWIIHKNPYLKEPSLWEYLCRYFKKKVLGKQIFVKREKWHNQLTPILRKNTDIFIEKYIHCYTIDTLRQIEENKFDAIIVGSDQIWRMDYFVESWRENEWNAFLSFTANWEIKRIAYAASFGTNSWEYPQEITNKIKELANNFDAISVREDCGVDLCRKHLGIEVCRLLDPTLLLNKDDYNSLITNEVVSNGNLMCYILDQTEYKTNVINKVSDISGLSPFYTMGRNYTDPQPPVEHWLAGFRDADMIITDSFHACIFSIIYHKPFIAIVNESRGKSRFTSLFEMLNIEENLIEEGQDIIPEMARIHLDYSPVENRLQKLIAESKSFLTENLEQ